MLPRIPNQKSSSQHHLWMVVLCLFYSICASSSEMTSNLYKPLFEAQRGTLVRPHFEKVSNSCIKSFAESLLHPAELAKALDATGKPESGILAGNLAWYGHFPECTNITDFHYCMVYIDLNVKYEEKKSLTNFQLQWGICVPDGCSDFDITHHADVLFEERLSGKFNLPGFPKLSVSDASARCVQTPVRPYDAGFIFTMVLCAFLGILMLGGMLLDVYQSWQRSRDAGLSIQADEDTQQLMDEYHQQNHIQDNVIYDTGYKRVFWKTKAGCACLLKDFSVSRNVATCLSTDVKDGQINCINGIRVMSMFWVILGHTYFFPAAYGGIQNPLTAAGLFNNLSFQVIINGVFSVDTFFLLSGFLTCYLTMVKMSKNQGKIPWGWFYFHRYYRLTPAMLGAILVHMYIIPYLMWGPRAAVLSERPHCPDYWWANLLYIQNFYPPAFGKACIAWTWYLANDMQFFLITPIILVALFRVPWLGISTILSLLGISFASTAAITYHFDFPSSALSPHLSELHGSVDYGNILYQKPYIRIQPYLVGMLLGYVMYRIKMQDRQVKLRPIVVAIGWLVAWSMGLLVIYGLYNDFNGHPFSRLKNTFFQTFARCAWGMAVGWVIFACHYGYGGWINTLLSWKVWLPLSRLTYSAYLLHPMVISVFVANMGQTYYVSNAIQAFYFCSYVALAYGSALLLALALEFPLANLEAYIMPRRK